MVVIEASDSGSGNSFATSRTAASLASMSPSRIIIVPHLLPPPFNAFCSSISQQQRLQLAMTSNLESHNFWKHQIDVKSVILHQNFQAC
jgi:hypothetical protein